MTGIVHEGCIPGLGAYIEAYPFEECCVPHVVTFGPSMYF